MEPNIRFYRDIRYMIQVGNSKSEERKREKRERERRERREREESTQGGGGGGGREKGGFRSMPLAV
jgi:hypothetical protein